MSACAEHEVRIEMDLNGVLDAPERSELERHLRACWSCKTLAAAGRRLEELATASVAGALLVFEYVRSTRQSCGSDGARSDSKAASQQLGCLR
jgi:anti-sigma factor RsiW